MRAEPARALRHFDNWLRARGVLPPKRLTHVPGPRTLDIAHVGFFTNANAGDTLLSVTLRDLFDQTVAPARWQQHAAHPPVDDAAVANFNRRDAVVVGGGGLFLRDTNPNRISGWQWAVSTEALRRIESPLMVFAVGYNRFRDQEDFDPVFTENVSALLETSAFFGLRNHGSIEAIRRYVPEALRNNVRFQPCMTTLISRLYPERFALPVREERPFIAVNCAFDRPGMRFGDEPDATLARLIEALRELSRTHPIRYYAHITADLQFSALLHDAGVPHQLVELQGRAPEYIIEEYRRPALVLGMRGHSQMIPFGCETPILSLISHDKMRWFLDDIDRPEWGVELTDGDSTEQIIETARRILARPEETRAEIVESMGRLHEVTMHNMSLIRDVLVPSA